MLDPLKEMAIPIRYMPAMGMDRPNVNKSIMDKLNTVKREGLWSAPQMSAKLPHTCVPQQFSQRLWQVWFQCWRFVSESLQLLPEKSMQRRRFIWDRTNTWSWWTGFVASFHSWGVYLFLAYIYIYIYIYIYDTNMLNSSYILLFVFTNMYSSVTYMWTTADM